MALQSVSQILSPNGAAYINGVAARIKVTPALLRNLYQGLVEKDGKGIDDNFVSSQDAQDAAQIFVHRVLPTEINPREIGSNKNGAAYSQNQHYTQTVTVGIDILQVIDDPILLPRVTTDQIPVDLLKEQIQIFTDRLATILNGATTASKYLATYLAKANGKEINETVVNTAGTGDAIRNAFVGANGLLDDGDDTNGIDIFPRKTRICVVKTGVGTILKTGGVLSLGGANEAYAILKAAGVSGDGERIEEDGFIGTIDGVEIRTISNESLKHASKFLGFPQYELKKSDFLGYFASSYANARGVSTAQQTKVVDEVNGQGIRLLPYVKFGAVCWYPKGNSLLVKSELNVFKYLRDLLKITTGGFDDKSNAVTFKIKSAGSRLYPVFSAITFTGTTAASVTAQALDDWSNDHLTAAFFYVGDDAVTSVEEFVKTYFAASNGPTYKGRCDLSSTGGTITTTIASNKYLNILAIADDGSCSIIAKKNA